MTYQERFGQAGSPPEGGVPWHEHDAGDISGTFGQVRLRGDLYSINWDGATPIDLSAGRDATAAAGFALDVSAGAAQFTNVYADGGELRTLDILGILTLGTGGVIRTAPTGQRIELSEADFDQIKLWGGSGAAGEAPGLVLATAGAAGIVSPYDDANPYHSSLAFYPGSADGLQSAAMNGQFEPSNDNEFDLGSATATWRALYCYGIYDEAGNLRLDLSELSYGANDSGGVGYKVIRVPN